MSRNNNKKEGEERKKVVVDRIREVTKIRGAFFEPNTTKYF